MAAIVLPFDSADPHYTVIVQLEGVRYLFALDWNDREGAWYLGISTEEEEALLSGVRCVSDWPLLRKNTSSQVPPGDIVFLDSEGAGADAGRDDLGDRVVPLYYPAADIAGL